MAKTVIVNSTPLISLSAIDQLDLLQQLYGMVFIPEAVREEIMAKPSSKAAQQLARNNSWLQARTIENIQHKQTFRTQLHAGEVEVMILGQELQADLLIMDDLLARKYADYLGFKVVGTIGILLLAKSKGLIFAVKPLLDQLIAQHIYIGNKLYSDALKLAKEIS